MARKKPPGVSGGGAVRPRGMSSEDFRLAADTGALTPPGAGTPSTPEEHARVLAAIRAAAARAQQQSAPAPAANLLNAVGGDDVQFLQSALTDYEVLERVQYGGQGAVYKAVQRATRRVVALKVLLDGPLAAPRQRARFAREVELCSRLQHPNIVTLYESGVVHGRNYCAMEFVQGLPIDEYVLLHTLPPRALVQLLATVCRAVHHAHQRGIIHRDLSPANIMVDLDGHPHVLDFGLAKDAWTAGDAGTTISMPGQVCGTLPYMSPEQAAGQDDEIDVRSDTYALGVVLFQLLAGGLPYPDADQPTKLRDQIVNVEPLRLRAAAARSGTASMSDGLTHDLEMILDKALAKDKECRYQSAAALADDLERYLAGDAVTARAASRLYLLRKAVRKHRWVFAVATLFVVVLGASATVVTTLWIEATAQRDNARRAAQIAHGTLDKVVTEIDEAIAPLAGGLAVRDRLLASVAADLPALEQVAASDAELVGVLARLHERQGDIAVAQGQRNTAVQHYQAFCDIAARETRAALDQTTPRRDLVRAHRKLATIAGDPKRHFQDAIATGTRLLDEHPEDAQARYELCQTHVEYARHFWLVSAPLRGVAEIEAALALAGDAAAGGDERWLALLALIYERESDLRTALGDAQRSTVALAECLRIREQLCAAHPSAVDCRHLLQRVSQQLARRYRRAGQIDAARRLYEESIAAGKYLVTAEPDVPARKHDLLIAHDGLVLLLMDNGFQAEAVEHCDAVMALATQLVAHDPHNDAWVKLLSLAHLRSGELSQSRHELTVAQAEYAAAVALEAERYARAPEDQTRQADLAWAYEGLGSCCRALRDFVSAQSYFEATYALRAALYHAQPDVFERHINYLQSRLKLAASYMDQHTAEADQTAEEEFCDVEAELLELEAAGRFTGQEANYSKWLPTIHRNRAVLARRAAQRADLATESIVPSASDEHDARP